MSYFTVSLPDIYSVLDTILLREYSGRLLQDMYPKSGVQSAFMAGIFNTEFREAFRRIIVSYIARDQCCNNSADRQRCSSRSGADNVGVAPGGHGFSLSPHHPMTPGMQNMSSGDMLPVPICDKIEITPNLSDGKITDI
ncbi:unnamed protein product [Oppiella nova]|uniref:Uncharacterized protein n=1 Tax=Oppiella nova TaxID=334625 RepID=A0A7R9LME6_9ACAR|nr:unnamed protein product [Oppiella nova]CAG2165040.1 unnamed protein product [Oppiella nova]